MEITYLGHACFRLKGRLGTVITDPYEAKVGWSLPNVSADVITVSHNHFDHNNVKAVRNTARRDHPFIIDAAGEYEVGGISVFGVNSYHDSEEGTHRGSNLIFNIFFDELRVCHLGDLGTLPTPEQFESIGGVDVLLCPVGGQTTIDAAQATQIIRKLEPSIVIPMHYRTDKHDQAIFGQLDGVEKFFKEMGVTPVAQDKLFLESAKLPEETQVVWLQEVAGTAGD